MTLSLSILCMIAKLIFLNEDLDSIYFPLLKNIQWSHYLLNDMKTSESYRGLLQKNDYNLPLLYSPPFASINIQRNVQSGVGFQQGAEAYKPWCFS